LPCPHFFRLLLNTLLFFSFSPASSSSWPAKFGDCFSLDFALLIHSQLWQETWITEEDSLATCMIFPTLLSVGKEKKPREDKGFLDMVIGLVESGGPRIFFCSFLGAMGSLSSSREFLFFG
jgi:hypothetical protein